jgi:hypothetical protein
MYCLFNYICKTIRSCCQNKFKSIDSKENTAKSQSQLPNHSNVTQLSFFNKFKKFFTNNNDKYNHQNVKDIDLNTIENTELISNSPSTSNILTKELKSITNNVNKIRSSINQNNISNQINT